MTNSYDAASVAEVLERDFARWGAPLVLRMDRAVCHRAPAVTATLARWGVMALHGPPHHPGFYGQLERQNREHRAWLDALATPTPEALPSAVDQMRRALNAAWPRRSLGFKTAETAWNARNRTPVDRDGLREEMHEWMVRLRCEEATQPLSHIDIERIAIEHSLERNGYLSREVGGWC